MIQGLGVVGPRFARFGLEDGGVQHRLGIRGIEGPFHRGGVQQVERGVRNAHRRWRRMARSDHREAVRQEERRQPAAEQPARTRYEHPHAAPPRASRIAPCLTSPVVLPNIAAMSFIP